MNCIEADTDLNGEVFNKLCSIKIRLDKLEQYVKLQSEENKRLRELINDVKK